MTPDFKRFLLYVFLLSLVIWGVSVYPLTLYTEENQLHSIVAGYFVSLISAILGFLLNTSALRKSTKSFMVMVFGGMGIRLLLIITIVALIIGLTKLQPVTLLGSVLFFYIFFMLLEIFFINKLKNNSVN
ncbi:MAG: hypothetical protein N2510_03420 [Ignavibacteria bacterium]|nr:hypothetical protein [Ignavibacteria bacterium]